MQDTLTPSDISAVQLRILKQARSHAMQHGLNETATLQYEIGLLYSELRRKHDHLNQFLGTGAKPQAGCRFHDVTWGDAEVKLEYEFTDGEPESWNGLTGVGHPGSPAEVSILQMLINGVWIDPDGLVHPDLIDRWETEIAEAREDSQRAAIEDYYDARRDERRKAA